MIYRIRREPHAYWRFLAEGQGTPPRSVALQELAGKHDGAETRISHRGLDLLREDLATYYGDDPKDWPVAVLRDDPA